MTTQPEQMGPCIRLLICLDENTIEELPDFDGPAEYDTLLELAIDRHTNHTSGTAHRGHLMKVEVRHWANPTTRQQIVKQIRDGCGGIGELDPKYYETKSTFYQDAMACFNRHLRPAGRCPDWRHESKELRPDTAAERKEAGLSDKARPKIYLCDFCPAKAYMLTKHREETGQYT